MTDQATTRERSPVAVFERLSDGAQLLLPEPGIAVATQPRQVRGGAGGTPRHSGALEQAVRTALDDRDAARKCVARGPAIVRSVHDGTASAAALEAFLGS